jgi:hypothetical protein
MKKYGIILYIQCLAFCPTVFSQSGVQQEETGRNTIGISLSIIYPDKVGQVGPGVETLFRHSLNNNFFYTISLGFGMAYSEDPGGQQFNHAITLGTLDHYAHYMLTTAMGFDIIKSEKHRAGISLGFAGRYSSKMYVNYAYHSLIPDEYPVDFFLPEMVEGYSMGVLADILYSYQINSKIGIQADTKCIIFTKFDNLLMANVGVFYRF